LKLYSYPRCSTCRKAMAWLQSSATQFDLIDITGQPPSSEELARALEQLGRKRLLNTSGQSYRASVLPPCRPWTTQPCSGPSQPTAS
jgi:arsenate reductase (glutaredoxin)